MSLPTLFNDTQATLNGQRQTMMKPTKSKSKSKIQSQRQKQTRLKLHPRIPYGWTK